MRPTLLALPVCFAPLLLALACGGHSASSDSTTTPTNAPALQALAPDDHPSTDPAPRGQDSDVTPPPGVTQCDHLTTRLCGEIAADTCTFARERIAQIAEDRCAAMHRHYAEVLADLLRYEAEQRPMAPELWTRATSNPAATVGPDHAAVVIVLFSDFQCPFCAGAAEATQSIISRYADRVRVIFRQFPLPFHRDAHLAAQASLAAATEGKFWAMHDQLFAHQGDLQLEALGRYAKEIGLSTANFSRALEDRTHAAAVDADLALGMQLGVNGTPTMFLNGVRVPNASDAEDITTRIDTALARSVAVTAAP